MDESVEASLNTLELASGLNVEKLAHNQLTSSFYSDLATSLEISQNKLFDLLGMSVGTRRRLKRAKKFTVMENDYALAQDLVIREALALFERNTTETVAWLVGPSIALNGRTPASLLSTLVGIDTVRALIWKIERGVYL